MNNQPGWRVGILKQALALAGYWVMPLRSLAVPAREDQYQVFRETETVKVSAPLLLLSGALNVYDEPVGRRPKRLGTLDAGVALVPIGTHETRPGLRIEAAEEAVALKIPFSELIDFALAEETSARALISGLAGALEQQHWMLRLAALSGQMERLATLLLAIAEDRGVLQEEGIYLDGAPDVRELGVLAGVSRESAQINLEWLVHVGLLRRVSGRLWIPDLNALRAVSAGNISP